MFGKKSESWLIVGLGNPGSKYERTRHNCGFRALDMLAEKIGCKVDKAKFQGLYGQTVVDGKKVYENIPLTEIAAYSKREIAKFWDEYTRIIRPSEFKVDLSKKLWDMKNELLKNHRNFSVK